MIIITKNILELFALDIDNKTTYIGSNLLTRELYFHINENDRIVLLSKKLYKKVTNLWSWI